MTTCVLTPAAGKRLIAKAMAIHPVIQRALTEGTLVIVAGTTNGYVAEEILGSLGIAEGFDKRRFRRGVTLPPGYTPPAEIAQEPFPGDIVLVRGEWQRGRSIFDMVEELGEGDVVLKGASALHLASRSAGVFIGDTRGGTTAALMQSVIGRRVRLIVPVGLEKRVSDDVFEIARTLIRPGVRGPRLFPLLGDVVSEIEAVSMLTGASARLLGAGGVCGAEGSVWLGISGSPEERAAAEALLKAVAEEPPYRD